MIRLIHDTKRYESSSLGRIRSSRCAARILKVQVGCGGLLTRFGEIYIQKPFFVCLNVKKNRSFFEREIKKASVNIGEHRL